MMGIPAYFRSLSPENVPWTRLMVYLLLLALSGRVAWAQATMAKPVDFDRDIAPIFQASCVSCHGANKPPAQLRLDSEAAVLRGGVSGLAIIAGDSQDSLLVKRLLGAEDQPRMPLGADPLSPAQIDLIRTWIDHAFFPAVGTSASPAAFKPVASHPQSSVDPAIYASRIRPLLAARCFQCHGPDVQQKGLRFDSLDSALKGSASGQVIIPGDSGESPLIRRLLGLELPAMPYGGPPLAPEEIALIRHWIDGTALPPGTTEPAMVPRPQKHWAYIKPVSPPFPKVKNAAWCRNPIDNFVLARLETEGLQPSPKADKITLLRRVTFDLTGLPPTPGEIDAFLADHSPDAYEKRVDQLLASPHYGERMAMPWLDLARYADTHGYHIDSLRDMWTWRDWVIEAFNQQHALRPVRHRAARRRSAPQRHRRAEDSLSGFNRNHMINSKAARSPKSIRRVRRADRVDTTSSRLPWASPSAAPAATITSSTPSRRRTSTASSPSSTPSPKRASTAGAATPRPSSKCPPPPGKRGGVARSNPSPTTKPPCPKRNPTAARREWQETRLATLPEPPRDGLLAEYDLEGNLDRFLPQPPRRQNRLGARRPSSPDAPDNPPPSTEKPK